MPGIQPCIDTKLSTTFTQFTIISFQSSKNWFLVLVRQDYLLKPPPFSQRKEFFKTIEDFSIIRLFGGEEKPFLLPFYVSDKHFVEEMCR
jgi:hypothetical protein